GWVRAATAGWPGLVRPARADVPTELGPIKRAPARGLAAASSPGPPRAGLPSPPADPAIPEAFYRVAGYHLCGPRAVRIDMLERLSDLIRPLVAWRVDPNNPAPPPKGATGDGGFCTPPGMRSVFCRPAPRICQLVTVVGFARRPPRGQRRQAGRHQPRPHH